jgi:hypothetical protein
MRYAKQLNIDVDDNPEEPKETWLTKLWDVIYDFYWKNLGWRIKQFWVSVKNLWRWLPVMWKDRDWDDHYIWEILKTKLKYQSKYIGSRDIHVNAKYDAERMMWCVRLIEKIQDEHYAGEYMDYHESRFNWLDIDGDTEHKRLEIEEVSENYDEYFAKHKAAVRKVLANKEYQIFELNDDNYKQRLAMNVGRYNEKRAQDLLFKLLNRDIRGWWD